MVWYEDMLVTLRQGGVSGDEAALRAGLLLERVRVHRPDPDDDGGIREILGSEDWDRWVNQEEFDVILEGLISAVDSVETPAISWIWALSKSHDRRAAPALIRVFERATQGTNPDDLVAHQALEATVYLQPPENSWSMLQWAKDHGGPTTQEWAREYLEQFPPP